MMLKVLNQQSDCSLSSSPALSIAARPTSRPREHRGVVCGNRATDGGQEVQSRQTRAVHLVHASHSLSVCHLMCGDVASACLGSEQCHLSRRV